MFKGVTKVWHPAVAALALTGIVAATPVCAAEVYPRDTVVFGNTYSGWSAAWQQWADSIPAKEHPLFDTADCSTGQSGPVWFLGGRFCVSGDTTCADQPAVRSCTVPKGKALFFPIVNFGCLNAEAAKGFCGQDVPNHPAEAYITQMRAAIANAIDQTVDLHVWVDGKEIQVDLKKDFRVQSVAYSAALPEGNLLDAIGEGILAGDYWGVDDGVYLMLQPLSQGQHTLRFKGTFPDYGFTIDFTYNLNVQK
ncbi:hypothetical protein M1B72_09140 [Geomonas paludis]|uniref:Lipoprotein n=1 Tax=Geomonas paludis TaxID=2740185 RepID=A0ABY4LIP8_9BACT|nr:hypothetical protein [Geomonas paludis]UPU37854.1 hypothetical protein M1B72_09140 [Geomonas paludis]